MSPVVGDSNRNHFALGGLQAIGVHPRRDDRLAFAKFLDSEHRVIIETEARLVVGFDTAKFRSFTNEAIQAGMAD